MPMLKNKEKIKIAVAGKGDVGKDGGRGRMKKMITLKEHIINYAKNKRYFNINNLKKYFAERGIDSKNDTLKEYLYLLKKENFRLCG